MIVLDTDHLRILQTGGPRADALVERLVATGQLVHTTIISVHENLKGWQDELNRAKRLNQQVEHYGRLERLLTFYAKWRALPFDVAAAQEFAELRSLRLGRLNTLDCRIAAIARSRSALLLSGEGAFRAVPGLHVEDWRA